MFVTSMGALFRVRVSYTNLPAYLSNIKNKFSTPVYGTIMNGSNVFETSLKIPGIIVMGNEACGISEEIMKLADDNLTIPNYSSSENKTESLNVAVSAAILCAEFRRQNSQ